MTNQGAFFGKGIKSNFRALQKCDDQILEAFANFGETPDVSENIIIQMERYTALLYTNRCDQSIKGSSMANQICLLLRNFPFLFQMFVFSCRLLEKMGKFCPQRWEPLSHTCTEHTTAHSFISFPSHCILTFHIRRNIIGYVFGKFRIAGIDKSDKRYQSVIQG